MQSFFFSRVARRLRAVCAVPVLLAAVMAAGAGGAHAALGPSARVEAWFCPVPRHPEQCIPIQYGPTGETREAKRPRVAHRHRHHAVLSHKISARHHRRQMAAAHSLPTTQAVRGARQPVMNPKTETVEDLARTVRRQEETVNRLTSEVKSLDATVARLANVEKASKPGQQASIPATKKDTKTSPPPFVGDLIVTAHRALTIAAALILALALVGIGWILFHGKKLPRRPAAARAPVVAQRGVSAAAPVPQEVAVEPAIIAEHLDAIVGQSIHCPINSVHLPKSVAKAFPVAIVAKKEAIRGNEAGEPGRTGRRLTLTLLARTPWDGENDAPIEVGYVDWDTRIIFLEKSLSRIIAKASKGEDSSPRANRIRTWLRENYIVIKDDEEIVNRRGMRLAHASALAA